MTLNDALSAAEKIMRKRLCAADEALDDMPDLPSSVLGNPAFQKSLIDLEDEIIFGESVNVPKEEADRN